MTSAFSVSAPDCSGPNRFMPLAGLSRDQLNCSAFGANDQPPCNAVRPATPASIAHSAIGADEHREQPRRRRSRARSDRRPSTSRSGASPKCARSAASRTPSP